MIATKARFNMLGLPNTGGNSRINLIAECERSLKRLKTDWIDLYQVHQWDGETPVEETMEALDSLVKAGKVRYVGCSNFSGWHIMKALAAAKEGGYQPFVSQQIHYTLQAREAEYELVPISLDQGLGILVWSPIAGGLLSGKFRRGKKGPEGSRHFALKWQASRRSTTRKSSSTSSRCWWRSARRDKCSAARVALAWLLGAAGRFLGHHRRADGGTVCRQSRRGRPEALGGGDEAAGGGEPPAAALSLLAPGVDGEGPARQGRPGVPRAVFVGASLRPLSSCRHCRA